MAKPNIGPHGGKLVGDQHAQQKQQSHRKVSWQRSVNNHQRYYNLACTACMTAFLQCAQSVHCVRPGMDIVKSYHAQQEEEVHAHHRQRWYVQHS